MMLPWLASTPVAPHVVPQPPVAPHSVFGGKHGPLTSLIHHVPSFSPRLDAFALHVSQDRIETLSLDTSVAIPPFITLH